MVAVFWIAPQLRGFEQVTESGHRGQTEFLKQVLAGQTPFFMSSQWCPEEFAPIMEAIEALFQKLGWRKPDCNANKKNK